MTIQAKLVATKRTENGSKQCRKLRLGGVIPGVIYGHEIEPVAISVPKDTLAPIVKAGTRIVDLEMDGKTEKALFREVQWDTFGMYLHHFDLVRINPDERVVVEVNIEVKGTPAGVLSGGLLEVNMRHIELECLAIEIPDSIVVRVGDLQIGQGIHVSDLELPANVKVLEKPDALVLHVVQVVVTEEDLTAATEGGPAQPEVIGRKVAEEGEEGAAEKPKDKK
jgi:large subunit ribosomal protein L25